jgi:hypothetical protein
MNTDIVAACIPSLTSGDAGAVCFVDVTGTSGDCPGARCRLQSLTVNMTNYSALACGM